MAGYFSNFQNILYEDTIAVNILQRVQIRSLVKSYGSIFYPYTIKDGERAEHIAFDYYGRSDLDWIIYLCNDIIDPVTQWPKSYLDFEAYINIKYGSLAAAQSQISYYQQTPLTYYVSNVDNSILSVAQYSPAVNGYNYTQITQDNQIRITPESYANLGTPSNYSAVYSYDDEYTQNEAKRNITLIDKNYSSQLQKDLASLLKN